ncbi:MAG: DUF3461 family protein [Acidiferrobacterales bacterium]|nr:DUF3461 family protein [Acidiferrobacterales bacterium]
MSDYPTLNEMGINNPGEIDRYSHQTVGNVDVLRVVYKRKKGSLLASSRRYRFNRNEELLLADSDARGAQVRQNISPTLRKAISELDVLVNQRTNKPSPHEIIRDELKRMKEDNEARYAYIESLLKELD